MKLSDYLQANSVRRGDFARTINVTPGWITQLCDGSGWPSRDVAEKIAAATGGMVTANDFAVPAPASAPQPQAAE